MNNKKVYIALLICIVVAGAGALGYFTWKKPDFPPFLLAKAVRGELRSKISTNGIIEPLDRTDIYAPVDGFIESMQIQEGSEATKGRLLVQLNSEQIKSALAQANVALLEAKRQARIVETGPPKEEISTIDASIAECAAELERGKKDHSVEESLYSKQATPKSAVESLQKQVDQLQLRLTGLKQRKQDLLTRYSAEEKEIEGNRVKELNKEVESLNRQLQSQSITAPISGVIYSLPVKQGAFVAKGQLIAQIYRPGKVMLRAYVDEPDLGTIERGQRVQIEWDGKPDSKWTGQVEKTAKQATPLNNRSIGNVLCSINEDARDLIPNINVKVEISTKTKGNVLKVPRSAIFPYKGQRAVLTAEGAAPVVKPVATGLVTADETEIVSGINEGDSVILNHAEVKFDK